MRNKVIGVYSVALGLLVLGLWAMILSGPRLPEGRTEVAFHLVSEIAMALAAIVSGALLLRKSAVAAPASAAAHAMVVYSTLNAAGYYTERSETGVAVAMMLLALLSGVITFVQVLRR